MRISAFTRAENYDPRQYPRAFSNLKWEIIGVAHQRRARRLFPALDDRVLGPCQTELADAHEHYVRAISTPEYAISLELAGFLLTLCRSRRPQSLLDLGSGFSSFVFRRYRAEAEPTPEVWSVDDNPAWLESTGRYLADQQLLGGRLVGLEELRRNGPGNFDLVLHDLNAVVSAARTSLLPALRGLLSPTGVVIVDDLNGYGYRKRVSSAAKASGLHLISLRPFLVDATRRYPGALVMPPASGGVRGP